MESKTKKESGFVAGPEKKDIPTYSVTLTSTAVVKTLAIAAFFWFLWNIKSVLGIFFVGVVLASALDPLVDKLERFRIPRIVSILGIFTFFFLVIGAVLYLIVPPFIVEATAVVASLEEYGTKIDSLYQYIVQSPDASIVAQMERYVNSLSESASAVTSEFFGVVSDAFSVVVAISLVMVFTFYLTIEEDVIKRFIRSVAPVQYQPYLVQKTNRIQSKMGAWLRGQLILLVIVGVLTYIGLVVLDIPYALVLASVAGLMEFVPFLGPILAAVPAMFFASSISLWKVVAVMGLYGIIQLLENNVLVPKIMHRAVGLNPIVVIFSMLVGGVIAGIPGVLLAVPAVSILWIFVEDLLIQKQRIDNQLE